MKRYKVIDTSSFQRLNIRPGASPSEGKLPSLPDWRAVQQPIYGRFRPVPGRPDRIEVRDPQGRLPPFVEPLLSPGRTVSSWPEVLVYGEPLTSVNRFSTRDGLRFASTGGTVPMHWVMAALGTDPVVAVLFVEATLDRGTVPQISVVSLRFDASGRATPFRRRSVRLASRPGRIIGNQGVRQPTSGGERLLAVYRAEFDGYSEIWLAEVDEHGSLSITPLADDRGGSARLSPATPAIASAGRVDSAFLAYAMQDDRGPSVIAGELRRDAGGRWSHWPATAEHWPVRHTVDGIPPYPFQGLAAQWDERDSRMVLAAVNGAGGPFLVSYDRLGNRLTVPQAFGECSEDPHGNVDLLLHPVTGRLVLQQQHNYYYFEREGRGFARYEAPSVPLLDDRTCARIDPFGRAFDVLQASGRPTVVVDELTQACVSPVPEWEFLVGGWMTAGTARVPEPHGGFMGNSPSVGALAVSIPSVWPFDGPVLGALALPERRVVLAVTAAGHPSSEPSSFFSMVRL